MSAVPLLWVTVTLAATAILVQLPIHVSFITLTFSAWGLVSLSDDQVRTKAARIREALSILRIPVTKAATEYMRYSDARDFERALAGEVKLDDWRLEMLGPEFQRLLALLTLRDLGLPELARTAIKVEPTLQQMKESA